MRPQISRNTLKVMIVRATADAAIEAEPQKRLLQSVKETDTVVVGGYTAEGSGCPLTLAGYWDPATDCFASLFRRAGSFAYAFDDHMADALFTPEERLHIQFPIVVDVVDN